MRHILPVIAGLLLAASTFGSEGITNVTIHLDKVSEWGTYSNLFLSCSMTVSNETNIPFNAGGFFLKIDDLDGKELGRPYSGFIIDMFDFLPALLPAGTNRGLKLLYGPADSPISLSDSVKTIRVRVEGVLYSPSPQNLPSMDVTNIAEAGSITSNIVEVHIP
ncbi:MAG TPA: hypothetical protein VGI03_08760 [Verrucomicrobiae bacterium]|jgi:hypothetical protein